MLRSRGAARDLVCLESVFATQPINSNPLPFRANGGKSETTADKVIALLVLVGRLAPGLLNWYLTDAGLFGR